MPAWVDFKSGWFHNLNAFKQIYWDVAGEDIQIQVVYSLCATLLQVTGSGYSADFRVQENQDTTNLLARGGEI